MKLKKEHLTQENKISANQFTWENYCLNCKVSSFDIFEGKISDIMETLKSNVKLIGWCNSENLQVRSRNNMVAIMVEFTDEPFEKVWLHHQFVNTDLPE
jgi:hypothetical protein